MKSIRNLALAAAAAGAFAAGTAAFAQDVKKDEPKAKTETPHARGQHQGHGMQGKGGMSEMSGMSGMRERCHAEQAKSGEHEHK